MKISDHKKKEKKITFQSIIKIKFRDCSANSLKYFGGYNAQLPCMQLISYNYTNHSVEIFSKIVQRYNKEATNINNNITDTISSLPIYRGHGTVSHLFMLDASSKQECTRCVCHSFKL